MHLCVIMKPLLLVVYTVYPGRNSLPPLLFLVRVLGTSSDKGCMAASASGNKLLPASAIRFVWLVCMAS
jgi:hypothetical protein